VLYSRVLNNACGTLCATDGWVVNNLHICLRIGGYPRRHSRSFTDCEARRPRSWHEEERKETTFTRNFPMGKMAMRRRSAPIAQARCRAHRPSHFREGPQPKNLGAYIEVRPGLRRAVFNVGWTDRSANWPAPVGDTSMNALFADRRCLSRWRGEMVRINPVEASAESR
jgi:hypothetical protein